MAITEIDSNDAGFQMAEEQSLGVLPVTPNWFNIEVNTFADFGADTTLVARSIIGSRKNQKGSITGIDPKSGFNMDFTKSNGLPFLQAFVANDVIQPPATKPINGAGQAVTAVATADDSYAIAAPFGLAKNLLLASGFTNAANNGLKHQAAVGSAGKITVTENLVDEGAPPAAAKVEVVGVEFASGDIVLTYAAPLLTMVSTVFDFTTLGRRVGEWVFLGDTANATNRFVTIEPGYARIATIAVHAITFDKTTFVPGADAGVTRLIRMFYGSVFMDGASTVKRTFRQQRSMGSDADGVMTEQLIGWGANEITLNAPKKDKFNADLSGIALDEASYTGAQGIAKYATADGRANGNYIAAPGEDAYNTSSDIYRMRIAAVDPTTLNPTSLFGYSTTATIKVSNGLTVNEAVGKLGGFSHSYGQFDIGGTLEVFFTSVLAIQAVRAKTPQTFDMIVARNNAGWVFDIPYCELSGALAKIEKNKPIMLPLNANGVQSPNGYVFLANYFPYLPAIAMPQPAAS